MKEEPHAKIQQYVDAANEAFARGAYSETEMQLCLAVREAETLASDHSSMLGLCRRELAVLLTKQGEFRRALAQFEGAIEAFDKCFGPDNLGLACLIS